jgi:hypothetical protein
MDSVGAKRVALILVLCAGVSACTNMGTIVDPDDPETEIPNGSLGRSIMEGLGAVPSRQPPINYSPRGPLVIPKDTAKLATPVDAKRLSDDPNWPVDPDVEMIRTLQEADAREKSRGDRGNLIPSSQLLAQRVPPAVSRPNPNVPGADPAADLVSPTALMNAPVIGGDATPLYDANGTPTRRALVEPPVTYLEPAPGAAVAIPPPPKKKGLFGWFGGD